MKGIFELSIELQEANFLEPKSWLEVCHTHLGIDHPLKLNCLGGIRKHKIAFSLFSADYMEAMIPKIWTCWSSTDSSIYDFCRSEPE